MNADRETNRLPLRAGAMLLLALAVVFIFLGVNSAVSGGDESPQDKLAEAGQSTEAAPSQPTAAPSGSKLSKASAAPSSVSAADMPNICVLNAGMTGGLAKKTADVLQSAGYTMGTAPSNLSTSSITENTIFYGAGQADAARKVAADVPGGAEAEARPAAFDKCPGEIVVIVVTEE